MKRNFLRLCLMMAVLLSFSCRQDLLPEKETYNNSGAFQLTSKRISLDEAKHKAKLLPELKIAEEGIETLAKKNLQGKTVNYGNGVSIDTENVIYIENGPNYHTYTFRIDRENAPADAPLENLVLSPLTDGTYKELLFVYNFTPQEKQSLAAGNGVDTKGKVTITELNKGTYNSSGLINKTTSWTCGYVDETIWESCYSGDHNGSNVETWGSCDATATGQRPPKVYTISVYKCSNVEDPNNPSVGNPVTTGPGYAGNPGSPAIEQPGTPSNCTNPTVLTGPQNPSTGTGDDGCVGVPTIPTLEFSPTVNPCAEIKAQRTDSNFQNKMTDLQGKTGLEKETGYIQKWGGDYEYKDNASATSTARTLKLPEVASNEYIKAFMHTHVNDVPNSTDKGIKMFSPADVVYFMDLIQNAQTKGESLSDPYAVMVTSTGNYQIRFTGNKFQIKTFSSQEEEYHHDAFGKAMEKSTDTSKKLELGFLKYIQKNMLLYGITLYRMNDNGTTTEIKLNADKTDTAENNCPN